ncbi:MAG: ComF family protein [Flavobacteriaceae bacterium]|nr:ComF family protein [Flavobacteriaceae bacterium]
MFQNLVNIFFPKVCLSCNNGLADNEIYVCTNCRHNLPVTNYHLEKSDQVKKVFYGRVKLENATALLRFQKKGIVQHLMHNLKYKGHEEIGTFLGAWLGEELKNLYDYRDIDLVIPVPLHKRKLRKRGYNQVALFSEEIAKSLNIKPTESVLIKVNDTTSQVNKSRLSRWNTSKEIFATQNLELIHNKHILLVDDIITTGATIEACANQLLQAKNVKISIATMAMVE